MSYATLISSSLPEGMRGALNKWFIEVLPGVYVGTVSKRIRDEVWSAISDWVRDRADPAVYAAMIESAATEQGFEIRTVGTHAYEVVHLHGLQLVSRQHKEASAGFLQDLPDPTW
ncbi:type I-E CRISPR-associated endoribonuclease Cas2e [Nocardioides houyundeii]|uniref:type I-E CRISPR-associated endoribonuclease Cas2e n=1 Tax=Nocardioides houyundeii TaxID=2045452 RepID=UPI000C792044|nr:type I-E CRISPR-associated endoribonuclease Cas2e [Nocardioides houyundeii]